MKVTREDAPAPRVLILCTDRRLSRGLALYAQDMGLDPVWQEPDSLPSDSPESVSRLMELCGAAVLWADGDDSPLLSELLPAGFPAVLWARGETQTAAGLPARIRRPVDTALLEKVTRRCLASASDRPAPVPTAPAPEPVTPDESRSDKQPALPALTPLEARVYACFADRRGELVTRDTLRTVLDLPADDDGNMADVYVYRLRKKLEKPGERLITAVRGKGYRMH